jgi:hypothetical protein
MAYVCAFAVGQVVEAIHYLSILDLVTAFSIHQGEGLSHYLLLSLLRAHGVGELYRSSCKANKTIARLDGQNVYDRRSNADKGDPKTSGFSAPGYQGIIPGDLARGHWMLQLSSLDN